MVVLTLVRGTSAASPGAVGGDVIADIFLIKPVYGYNFPHKNLPLNQCISTGCPYRMEPNRILPFEAPALQQLRPLAIATLPILLLPSSIIKSSPEKEAGCANVTEQAPAPAY